MKKFLFAILLVAFVSGLILGSTIFAANKPQFGGTLKIATTSNPAILDPPCAQSNIMREIVHHIFEELVTIDQNFKIVPMLAKSYEVSKDGLTYTFYLRQGVKFHNGQEMTAEDVVASIDPARKVSYDLSGIDQIDTMAAKDKYTVVIGLKKVSSIFLFRLATEICPVAIMPKQVIDGVAARDLKDDQLIGTGPFKMKEWVRDRYIKLEKFKGYAALPGQVASGLGGSKIAYFDELDFIPTPEASSRLAGLQTGEFDFVRDLPRETLPVLKGDSNLTPVIVKPSGLLTLMFNTMEGITKDVKLRQAISLGINCKEILEGATGSKEFYDLNGSMFSRDQVWYSKAGLVNYNRNDVKKASQLIKQLGYEGAEIRIVTSRENDILYKTAIIFAEQLKKIGLKPKLNVVDWATNVNKFTKDWSDWEISFTFYSMRLDPIGYRLNFCGSIQPYKSETMNKLFEQVESTIDFKQRYQLVNDFQELLASDRPIYKIGDFYTLDAERSNVKGYKPYSWLPRLWNVWKTK